MIPPELLQMISSTLYRSDQDLPVIFAIPLSYQLHRLLARSPESVLHAQSASVVDPLPLPDPQCTVTLSSSPARTLAVSSKSSGLVNLLWTQTFLRKTVVMATLSNGNGNSSVAAIRHSISIPTSALNDEVKLPPRRQALDLSLHHSKHPVALPLARSVIKADLIPPIW